MTNTTFAFEMRDNHLGITGENARKSPELLTYLRSYPKSFEYHEQHDFWFFYPPEKYGAADFAIKQDASQKS